MSATATVPREQAEAVLEAIKQQFRIYLETMTLEDGWVLPPSCPEPTLVEDYDGAPFAILWEEGPCEWTYRAFDTAVNPETYELARAEGIDGERALKIATEKGVKEPAGVYTEPYSSFVLAVYPEAR